MAGLKKSDLVARNAELRERIAALEDALHGGMLASALDAMSTGVADAAILLDDSYRVTHFNSGAERLFGIRAGEILGKSVLRLFADDSAAAFLAALQGGGSPADLVPARATRADLLGKRRDGTVVPVQATVTGWRQAAGVVRAVVLRDLSPIHAAAETVRESEHRFEALADAAPVGIYRTDLQGRCLYVSTRWKEITGLDDVDALGDQWLVAIHPEDQAWLLETWQEAVAAGADVKGEYRLRHSDGRDIWVLGQAVPERDGLGRIIGYVGTVTDISAQKELEQALRQQEASFRLLFQDNPAPMWVYDRETLRFLEVNDAARQVYGYSREEWLGMTLADIRPEEDVPRLLEDVARPREPYQRGTSWRHRRKCGAIFPVRFASHVLTFQGRDAVLVVVDAIEAAVTS